MNAIMGIVESAVFFCFTDIKQKKVSLGRDGFDYFKFTSKSVLTAAMLSSVLTSGLLTGMRSVCVLYQSG